MVMYWLGFGTCVCVGGKFDVAVEDGEMADSGVGGMPFVAVEFACIGGACVIAAGMVANPFVVEGMLQAFEVTIKIARAN